MNDTTSWHRDWLLLSCVVQTFALVFQREDCIRLTAQYLEDCGLTATRTRRTKAPDAVWSTNCTKQLKEKQRISDTQEPNSNSSLTHRSVLALTVLKHKQKVFVILWSEQAIPGPGHKWVSMISCTASFSISEEWYLFLPQMRCARLAPPLCRRRRKRSQNKLHPWCCEMSQWYQNGVSFWKCKLVLFGVVVAQTVVVWK